MKFIIHEKKKMPQFRMNIRKPGEKRCIKRGLSDKVNTAEV